MSEEYKKRIGIPENHTLKLVSSNSKGTRKGRDTDEYIYRELDTDGNIVATYEIEDSTSTYPPFGRTISYNKV